MQYKLPLHIPFIFWNAEISLLNYYFFVKIEYLRNIQLRDLGSVFVFSFFFIKIFILIIILVNIYSSSHYYSYYNYFYSYHESGFIYRQCNKVSQFDFR